MEHLIGVTLHPREIAHKFPAKEWERYLETLTWTSDIQRDRYGKDTQCSPSILVKSTKRNDWGGKHTVVMFDLGASVDLIESALFPDRVDLIRTLKREALDSAFLSVSDVLPHPFTFRVSPLYRKETSVVALVHDLNSQTEIDRGLFGDYIIQEDSLGKRLMVYMPKFRDIVAVEAIRGDDIT